MAKVPELWQKIMKYLVLVFAGPFLFCCVILIGSCSEKQKASSKTTYVQEVINKIPRCDYVALDRLFRCLVFENYLAYTLFGQKPMTYYGAFYEQPAHVTMENPNSEFIFLNYWEIWKKYSTYLARISHTFSDSSHTLHDDLASQVGEAVLHEHCPRPLERQSQSAERRSVQKKCEKCGLEFQTKNFFFKEEKSPELFGILFINKKNVLRCVRENMEIFKEILGNDITPEKVLQALMNDEDLSELLKDNHILCGILFGFGKENATHFHQKFGLDLALPDPIPFHHEDPEVHPLPLPYFMTFYPNAGTDRLRKQYIQDRKRILEIYSKGNFLEITLMQLLSEKV
jgi:hypothetical protein